MRCEDCGETFANAMARHYHKLPKGECLDPRTDLEYRVNNKGHWTLKAHRMPPNTPLEGFFEDQQTVAYREP